MAPRIPFFSNLFSSGDEKQEARKGVAVGAESRLMGRVVAPSFMLMMKYKESNPFVAAGIDELSEVSVGGGSYYTCKNKVVKELAEDFFEDMDGDAFNLDMATDVWATGNTLLEIEKSPKEITEYIHLPIGSVYKIKTDIHGKVTRIDQKIESNRATFKGAQLTKFKLLSRKKTGTTGLGVGLLNSLMNRGIGYKYIDGNDKLQKAYRPSFQEITEQIEDSSRKIIVKYVPRHIVVVKGMDDTFTSGTVAPLIKNEKGGDDIVIGLPTGDPNKNSVELLTMQTDPRSKLHPYAEYFFNSVITAMQTPSIRLFIEAGFTEASSKTAVELRDQKVASYRRWHRRRIEQLTKPYIIQEMGWKPADAAKKLRDVELKFNWNPIKKPEISNEQLVAIMLGQMKSGIWLVTPKELRGMLRKRGIEIDEEITETIDKLYRNVIPSGIIEKPDKAKNAGEN